MSSALSLSPAIQWSYIFGDRTGRQVGDGTDEPDTTQRQQRQAQQLDPRPHQHVAPTQVEDPREVLEVLGGLLDADDVGVVSPQACHRLGCHVDCGADRHVVQHDRHVGEGRGRPSEYQREQTFLRRPRVVGRDHQGDVGAEIDRRLVSAPTSRRAWPSRCRGRRGRDRRPRRRPLRMAAMRSATVCALGSPVDPPIEMPCEPDASCHRTRLAEAGVIDVTRRP